MESFVLPIMISLTALGGGVLLVFIFTIIDYDYSDTTLYCMIDCHKKNKRKKALRALGLDTELKRLDYRMDCYREKNIKLEHRLFELENQIKKLERKRKTK